MNNENLIIWILVLLFYLCLIFPFYLVIPIIFLVPPLNESIPSRITILSIVALVLAVSFYISNKITHIIYFKFFYKKNKTINQHKLIRR